MFANKILSVLHKDENFIQSYELRMTVHMVSPFGEACQKLTGQKSLSTYRKAKKCLWNQKNCKSALILRLATLILFSASQYLKLWFFCWVGKTSLQWTLVLQVVLSYYVAFCYCKLLVILLFQLSLGFERLTELDTHS